MMNDLKKAHGVGLGKRITKIVVLALGLLIILGGSLLYISIKNLLISQFDQVLLTKAQTLTQFPEAGRTGINLNFTEKPLPEFQEGENPEYYQVWLKEGSVLARSPSLASGENLPKSSRSAGQTEFSSLTLPNGRPGRAVALRINSRDGAGSDDFLIDLTLARSSEGLNRILQKLIFGFSIGGIGLLLLAWMVVRRAARTALRPVDALASQVADIDAESLESRIPVESLPVDLQPIAAQINDLVKRLAATFARERRFASNAAHELLTPVSELRIAADNALDWPDDPRATASLAKDSCELAEQMDHVVRSLLTLSRAEAHLTPVNTEAFNFAELVRELLESFQPQITSRNLNLISQLPEKIEIDSDRVIARSVLTNLLLNAIEYSTESGTIEVTGSANAQRVTFKITNQSEQITPEDLDHFCEAFWRGDQARTSREHTGLGLALTNAFVRLLSGDLHFEIKNEKTIVTRLHLPKSRKG